MKKLLIAVCPALLIGITAFLLWSSLTNGHNWGGDFSAYIMQAKSITEGSPLEFIEANRFTIEQSSRPMGPVTYPWGFPALLAPFYAIFGLDMIALKSVGLVCYLLFLFLLWGGFRKYHSDFWRFILLCLFALNPTMLQFINNILADIPFLLVSTFSVLLIGRLVIERRRLISPACDQLLLGAAIAAAFFIRTNGILLLVTLGITQFIVLIRMVYGHESSHNSCSAGLMRLLSNKRVAVRHLCMNILPYVSFVSFVLVWQALLPDGGSSHVSHVDAVSMRSIASNVLYYIKLPSEFFSFDYIGGSEIGTALANGATFKELFEMRGLSFLVYVSLYGASIPLAITGVVSRYRSDPHIVMYVALTFLLYILWPSIQGLRFIFPVLPFYMSFMLSPLEKYVGNNIEPTGAVLRKVICILPLVLLLLFFGNQSASDAFGNLSRNRASISGPFSETSRSMFSYIERNTEVESTVVFFRPRVMRMMTSRKSLMITKVGDLSYGDYLCLYASAGRNQISPEEVRSLAAKGAIKFVYGNRDFVVYRLNRTP